MALQVIGAGFGRTGTFSLKLALERLGFTKCHHMKEVFGSRTQVDAWYALSRGETVDWDDVFEGFAASCDWPSSAYWEELYHHYPDSRVILTTRDPERWYTSALETIYAVSTVLPRWLLVFPRISRAFEMIHATIWDGIFDARFEDKPRTLEVYQRHLERVRSVAAPERLLVFEAKEGWEPLCAFLGVPVPDTPYPHVNEAAEIKRAVKVLRVLGWLPWILVLALVLFLLA